MAFKDIFKRKGNNSVKNCTPLDIGSGYISVPNFSSCCRSFWDHNYMDLYRSIASIATIINKRAECFGNAKPYILDRNGNEPKSTEVERFRKLFKNPNYYQDWQSFYINKEIAKLVDGYAVIFLNRDVLKRVRSMYVVPSGEIRFHWNNKKYLQTSLHDCIDKVEINGIEGEIDINDIVIFRDINQFSSSSFLLGESRLSALKHEAAISKAISEAENVLIQNRGALGILTRDTSDAINIGQFEDEREKIQEDYKQKYGLKFSKDQIIITTMPLKWEQITQPIKDLMLPELDQEAIKKIAGVYNVPYNLLPYGSDSTFSNQKEAKKALYQEQVIPISEGDAQLFSKVLGLEELGLTLRFDYSDLYLFQEDMKEKADTINQMINAMSLAMNSGILSKEEVRLELSNYLNIDPNKV